MNILFYFNMCSKNRNEIVEYDYTFSSNTTVWKCRMSDFTDIIATQLKLLYNTNNV